jgi:hypothetical protein
VVADGALGQHQPRGDVRVAQPAGQQREHLQLPRREAGGVAPGGGTRAAR